MLRRERPEDEGVKQLIKNTRDAALDGENFGLAICIRKEQDEIAAMLEKVYVAAEEISNEVFQQTLLDAARMIEDFLPQHIAAAREALENPNDQPAKDQLEYLTDALIYAWDNLVTITQQPVMPELISAGMNTKGLRNDNCR